MPIQHTTAENKWKILLKTLGTKEVEVTKVTDDKITIKVDRQNLDHLRKVLGSKETLLKNTVHALFCDDKNPNQNLATGTHNYTNTIDIKNIDWFKRMVGDQFLNQNNLSQVFDDMMLNAQFNENLLTTQLQLTLTDEIQYLTFRLQIRNLQANVTDENLLVKILSVKEQSTAENQFYTITFIVNNGAHAQTLQARRLDGRPPLIVSDLKDSFIIDKQYLMEYLTPVFNNLVWYEEEKVPIIFNASRPESLNEMDSHYITIVIDTSGSMAPNFPTYISYIKYIISKLDKIPNWQIRIIRFFHESREEFFSLANGNTIDDIKRHVDTFIAEGGTRLYCTVQDALNNIKGKLTDTPDLFSTLMVFTDGDDTVGGCTEDSVINASLDLKAIPQFNMYAIGFGAQESGFQKFFKRIAESGGFVHIKLDDPNGMTQLQQYIANLAQKINIWEILQGELKLAVARVPEGDAFLLDSISTNIQGLTVVKNDKEKFKIGTDEIKCTKN